MKYETIVCPFCGNGHAHITYEENRVYQMNCPDCHNAIFHRDTSWDNAVNFFKRMVITDEAALWQQETVTNRNGLKVVEIDLVNPLTPDEVTWKFCASCSPDSQEDCRKCWIEWTHGNNLPLTLDELQKMDGEPVWVVWTDGRIKSQWFIISSTFWIEMFKEWDGTLSKDYGKTWLAYRQKPEDGTV